jgi:ComF family protein
MFESEEGIVNLAWRCRLTIARGLSRLLGSTLFPPRCCLCEFEGTWPDLDLCAVCLADLPWETSRSSAQVAALRFEAPVDHLIRELKYHGVTAHARVLGELLARAVRERGELLPRVLLPVPLHRSRYRERGFNQALQIARYAGGSLGIPFTGGLLRRVRDTPSQTGLGRGERITNVRGAFGLAGAHARKRLSRTGHVALVDDVTTTGSTLGELRDLLLEAGVHRVDLWTVARAVV